MAFWSVVQVEPKREHLARVMLMQQGYETYAPRTREKTKGKVSKIVLLFPSYFFARVVTRWSPIVWTPGVLRLLMRGEAPACVSDEFISALRKCEGRDRLVHLPRSGFRYGQPVTITRGGFTGHVAIYQHMNGTERSWVLLNMLGGLVEVNVATNALRAAE